MQLLVPLHSLGCDDFSQVRFAIFWQQERSVFCIELLFDSKECLQYTDKAASSMMYIKKQKVNM